MKKIHEIARKLQLEEKIFKITWDKRKSNNEWERAHKLAKAAVEKEEIHLRKGWLSKLDFKRIRYDRIIRTWQQYWDISDTGRITYRYYRQIGRDRLNLTSEAVQIIIGHGNMKAYLKSSRFRPGPGVCPCGGGNEDSEHIMWQYTAHSRLARLWRLYFGMHKE
ncbi:hypothetical protein GWI33_016219 [Rhynchophorus ferrugineus]|uniref:Uncharacterized protein n=1 Tax=Rhynchophorus ferrugineus TaxID=354439 RepID=A0A834HXQ4_RHYFE|nr:hypothetical protein GWI33_016219 [Rhynchophorus ferrugineus]